MSIVLYFRLPNAGTDYFWIAEATTVPALGQTVAFEPVTPGRNAALAWQNQGQPIAVVDPKGGTDESRRANALAAAGADFRVLHLKTIYAKGSGKQFVYIEASPLQDLLPAAPDELETQSTPAPEPVHSPQDIPEGVSVADATRFHHAVREWSQAAGLEESLDASIALLNILADRHDLTIKRRKPTRR